jgi:hypothetical protein
MALPIPQRYVLRVNLVRKLSDDAFEGLVSALSTATIRSTSEAMAAEIGAVAGIDKDDLEDIVDLVYAIYHVREFSELSHREFFREFLDGIKKQSDPPVSEDELKNLGARVRSLLQIENLQNLGKAINLQREGERLYCGSRIISDLRPVFGEEVKDEPEAVVLMHTLKLSYHENGEHRSFFLILDEADLSNLRSVIERAQTKSETLNAFITPKIPRLGV